jgi:hypothetical protein
MPRTTPNTKADATGPPARPAWRPVAARRVPARDGLRRPRDRRRAEHACSATSSVVVAPPNSPPKPARARRAAIERRAARATSRRIAKERRRDRPHAAEEPRQRSAARRVLLGCQHATAAAKERHQRALEKPSRPTSVRPPPALTPCAVPRRDRRSSRGSRPRTPSARSGRSFSNSPHARGYAGANVKRALHFRFATTRS